MIVAKINAIEELPNSCQECHCLCEDGCLYKDPDVIVDGCVLSMLYREVWEEIAILRGGGTIKLPADQRLKNCPLMEVKDDNN